MSLWAQSPHPIASFLVGMHVFNVGGDLLKTTFLLSSFSQSGNERETGPVRPWTEAHSKYHLRIWLGNAFIGLIAMPRVFMCGRLKFLFVMGRFQQRGFLQVIGIICTFSGPLTSMARHHDLVNGGEKEIKF
jgi:hypothetical protein